MLRISEVIEDNQTIMTDGEFRIAIRNEWVEKAQTYSDWESFMEENNHALSCDGLEGFFASNGDPEDFRDEN